MSPTSLTEKPFKRSLLGFLHALFHVFFPPNPLGDIHIEFRKQHVSHLACVLFEIFFHYIVVDAAFDGFFDDFVRRMPFRPVFLIEQS
jgi:hypothetical protein